MLKMNVKLRGLQETQAKLKQVSTDMRGSALKSAMRDATLVVTRSAKENAPVDTGRLRSSITPDVRGGNPVKGVVGSNLAYAPYMELGTGTFAGRGRHQPPSSALDLWARRHGFSSGFVVARIIGRRGGLKPRRYLQKAFETNIDRIKRIFDGAVNHVVEK